MDGETARTRLRAFQPSDLEELHEYTSQPEVGEMAGWKPHTTINESLHTLKMYLNNPNVAAVVSKENGAVIGHIAVYEDTKNRRDDTREIGFALHRDYQGCGIMTEVVKTVVERLLAEGVQQIYACCRKENVPAAKLLTACGFQWEREGEIYSRTMKQSFVSCEYVCRAKRERDRTTGAVLMNFVMVCDGDKVLVENRVGENYPGIAFPGGHVEAGESLTEAAIREVYEETGLKIEKPRLLGIKDWEEAGRRYLIFLYRADRFEGTLKSSEEGEVRWVREEELGKLQLAEGMDKTIEVMLREDVSELYFHQEEGIWQGTFLP